MLTDHALPQTERNTVFSADSIKTRKVNPRRTEERDSCE